MALVSSAAVAFKYKGGVMIAANDAASYGSMAVDNVQKIFRLTDRCLAVFTGSVGDINELHRTIMREIREDPRELGPMSIHKFVQRELYQKRSEMKPLELAVIICGIDAQAMKQESSHGIKNTYGAEDEEGRFLGIVNSKGNFWFDQSMATGLASHLILPILRERDYSTLSREEATALAEECMRILFYKDCKASDVVILAFCEEGTQQITEAYPIETNWNSGIMEGEIVVE
ncbi:20S proteasome subunit beta 7 [Enteropsectra breve]|nr:20S proteasome subunit beta 7 [Enteropsectra breve]